MSENDFDKDLLERFEKEIWSKIPHLENIELSMQHR